MYLFLDFNVNKKRIYGYQGTRKGMPLPYELTMCNVFVVWEGHPRSRIRGMMKATGALVFDQITLCKAHPHLHRDCANAHRKVVVCSNLQN